ncbi:MAG: hypothetical protein WD342_14345 [Verrucomicrobiales bacterium]
MKPGIQNAVEPGKGTPPPLPHIRNFQDRLSALLKTWRRGEFFSSLLRLSFFLIVALAAFAALDYFLASGNEIRQVLLAAALACLVAAALRERFRIRRLNRKQLARRADGIVGGRRRSVLSALELLGETKPESADAPGFRGYLVHRSVEEANSTLGKIDDRDVLQRKEMRRRGLRCLVAILVVATALVFLWPVSSVLFARVLQPWIDIPPYSPLIFYVDPDRPEIFYGEDATVTVEITGGETSEPVRFLARRGDEVFETVCFQDGPNRFAQRLERVVQPTEFAFAHGRARSRWHRIDLLLEPKVALASVTVTPPDYSGMPARTFLIGEEPLAALRGSRMKLSITSNRPLSSGDLEITPVEGNPLAGRAVAGKKTGPQTTTFEWRLDEEADLTVAIRDVRGTPNRDPIKISQKVIPDKAPSIALDRPPLHLMATPSIQVPLEARVEDDFGLARVELVRTVAGYRDRMKNVSPATLDQRFDYRAGLELASLGVAPGETLELYLQATDRNPSLLGVAASEVARIQIISDEEYANIIRTRTTLEEFEERYRIVAKSLAALAEKLAAVREARDGGDAQAEASAREAAAGSAADAEKLFEMLAKDFAAFDIEQTAIDQAQATLGTIRSISDRLDPAHGEISDEQLADMLEAIGAKQKDAERLRKTAEEVASVGRVMEMAAEFARLAQDQDMLTRRLKRFEAETRSADVPFLNALGEDQQELREQLEAFAEELGERVRELPSGYDSLAVNASKFADELKQTKIEFDMETAGKAAGNEDGSSAFQYSSLALEKMNALMQSEESQEFSAMANGEMQFKVPPRLEDTLAQMLSSICLRRGGGSDGDSQSFRPGLGGGGGTGYGGNPEDGYSMAGYTALDIPVVGPPRMRLRDAPSSLSELADDGDAAPGKELPASASETDRIRPGEPESAAGAPMPLDRVPEKYREAVKRYFTPGKVEESPNPNPSP